MVAVLAERHSRTDENLVFEEEFDGSWDNWNMEESLAGGGNFEFQYFTKNSRVVYQKEGELVITPQLFPDIFDNVEEGMGIMNGSCSCHFNLIEKGCNPTSIINLLFNGCDKIASPSNWLNSVASAHLDTRGKRSFKYGRFEMKAKLPKGDWLWPSFWMAPEVNSYGDWPASGGIDIAETRGNNKEFVIDGKPAGRDTINSALHFGNSDALSDAYPHESKTIAKDFSDKYYIFGTIWEPDFISTYYIDPDENIEHEIFRQNFTTGLYEIYFKTGLNPWQKGEINAPFDKPFYLAFDLSAGGVLPNDRWWGPEAPWKNQPNMNKLFWDLRQDWLPTWTPMRVDYIRVYQTQSSQPEKVKDKDKETSLVLLWVGLGVAGLFVGLMILYLMCRRKVKNSELNESLTVIEFNDVSQEQGTLTADLSQVLSSGDELSRYRINAADVSLEKVISRGAFGIVWRGTYHGEHVAVKKIIAERINEHEVHRFVNEITLMAELSHPNIVRFLGMMWTNNYDLAAVSEYIEGGDLRQKLADPTLRLSWKREKQPLALGIATGLAYLHAQDPIIIHRDLKSRNVLVTSNWVAKIVDFGLSKRQHIDETMTSGVGTLLWTAPEILRGEKYSDKADIYSYGVILTELDSRKLPYHHKDLSEMAIAHNVANGALSPYISPDLPRLLRELIKRCVNIDQHSRPSANEIIAQLNALKF